MGKQKKIYNKPRKPLLPEEVKDQWEYVWARNNWLVLPKNGIGMPRLTISEVKKLVKK